MIADGNRKGTQEEKRSAFDQHIAPALGDLTLDKIDQAAIQKFKAELAQKKRRGRDTEGQPLPLSRKTRNNILAVLSNALRFAEEVRVIEQAPRVKLARVERPEIDCLEFEEYARVVASARRGELPGMLPCSWPAKPGSASAASWRCSGRTST